jgi:polyphenol oxidase
MIHFKSPLLGAVPSLVHAFVGRETSLFKYYDPELDEETKAQNKRNVQEILHFFGLENANFVCLKQVHSNRVVLFDDSTDLNQAIEGDALITQRKDLVLAVLSADCGPILMVDPKTQTFAAIHAGWRGALSGIVEETLHAFEKLGAVKENIYTVIGPCVGQMSYEVGTDMLEAFLAQDKTYEIFFLKHPTNPTFFFDLRRFIHKKCKSLGLKFIDHVGVDTYQNPHLLKSYRRLCHLKNKDRGNNVSFVHFGAL